MKILCLFFLCFICCAHSYEKIERIGKIIYSKETRSYYFIYISDSNKIASHQLAVKSKRDLKKFKELLNKSVRIEGKLDWETGSTEFFSLHEKLTVSKMEIFELNVLAFNSKKMIQQDNFISRYKVKMRYQTQGVVIEIPDKAADTSIALGAIAVGVAAGPMSLIPAAVWGITQLFL